jgi:hypothetical protein
MNKKEVVYLTLSLVFSGVDTKLSAQTYYSPGGTYTDWFFPSTGTYSSLEWTFVPVADPPESLAKDSLLHYYAYNFDLVNATSAIGGGYDRQEHRSRDLRWRTKSTHANRRQNRIILVISHLDVWRGFALVALPKRRH